jgi:DNA polymerase III epsilon subunit-like protein
MTIHEIIYEYNSYVKIGIDIEISEKVTEITGITNKKCQEEGKPIEEVIGRFLKSYNRSDVFMAVAHNIEFDIRMIEIERHRNVKKIQMEYQTLPFEKIHFCTMRNSSRLSAEFRRKLPKLSELYEYLFKEPAPVNLHDSKVDTFICMKCFVEMRNLMEKKRNHLECLI